jgi:aspartate racemase
MSWESSIAYERIINEEVRERLGGVHSADLIIRSYDFADIEELQTTAAWAEAGRVLAAGAAALQGAGAELIILCTNTMHRVADAIIAAVSVPFLHIADATAAAIKRAPVETVALLGTRYTMEEPFYRERLEMHGIEVVVPEKADRESVHNIIFEELVRGVINEHSRHVYLEMIERLIDGGAQGVVAGCTEIELLVPAELVAVPYFPTTKLHALAAVEAALDESG